jgi:hypothetical protein
LYTLGPPDTTVLIHLLTSYKFNSGLETKFTQELSVITQSCWHEGASSVQWDGARHHIRNAIRETTARIKLHHAGREALDQPHYMTNWARRTQRNVQGRPNFAFIAEHNLNHRLKETNFTWEDLEPD